MDGRIYLDWNATTPPLAAALDEQRRVAGECWANPASVHLPGQRARAELDRARRAIASLVELHPRDVLLTSGGTEANNLALRSAEGPIVTSRLEHPSVVRVVEQLEREGVLVGWVEPGAEGRLSPAAVEAAIATLGRVALVSVQAVNHETGVIQPVTEIAEVVHRAGARLHCDAVQAAGRLPASSFRGADLVSVAAHKLRGPKGIGALVTRPGVPVRPLVRGGEQERGLRPGTQDAGLAAGFRVAAEHALDGPVRYAKVAPLRDRLEDELVALGRARGIAVERNGGEPRAPHVANLSWAGWRGPELCAALDLAGLAVSSGAACSAGTAEPSPVIRAMLGETRATAALRLSLGESTTSEEVAQAVARFATVLNGRALLEIT